MAAKVGSMYTGTEIEMSFKVKLEDVEEKQGNISYGM